MMISFIEDISHKNRVSIIINKLNVLYKKDELNKKFEDPERFEGYKRSLETPMPQFLADIQQAYNRLRCHGITICDNLSVFNFSKLLLYPIIICSESNKRLSKN